MLHDLITENGWHKCDAVDCDISVIPGTDISIPTRAGAATTVLNAGLHGSTKMLNPCAKASVADGHQQIPFGIQTILQELQLI